VDTGVWRQTDQKTGCRASEERSLKMASTLLELSRGGHEEMEVGENRIVKLLAAETKTHKQKLIQQV